MKDITLSDIDKIVKTVIDEVKDAWNWGEGIDMPVLWLRVDKVLGIKRDYGRCDICKYWGPQPCEKDHIIL